MSSGQTLLSQYQSRLVLAFFCLFPWLYFPGTHEIYALRETLFFGLTGALILIAGISRNHLPLHTHPLDFMVVIGFIIRLFSWMTFCQSTNFEQPLLGVHSLLFELSLMLFYFQVRRLKFNRYFSNVLASYFLGSCLFICILASFMPPISANADQGRWQALFFHPNFLGIFSVIILALVPELKLRWKISGVVLVLLSGSRLALGLLIILTMMRSNFKVVLSVAIIGLLFLGSRAVYNPVESFRLTGTDAFQMRSQIYQGTLETIKANPLGTGPGVFGPKVHQYLTTQFNEFFPDPSKHSVYKAHNSLLEWTAESGWLMALILGISIFFVIMLPNNQLKLSLCLLSIASVFSVIINYPSGLIIFTLLLAIAIPANQNQNQIYSSDSNTIRSGIGAFLIRLIIPTIVGISFLLYGYLNFQAQLGIPRIINHLSEGQIYPAWSELKQRSFIPALQLENLYYQFRITTLAGKKTPLVNFFEKNLSSWVDVSFQLSLLSLQKREYERALYFIEKSIDYHPLWSKNYFLKADILTKMGQRYGAENALEKAKKLNRYDVNFRNTD